MVKGFVEQKGIRSYDEAEPEGSCPPTMPQIDPQPQSQPAETAHQPAERVAESEMANQPAEVVASKPTNQPVEVTDSKPSSQVGSDEPEEKVAWPPKRTQRSCVASMVKSQTFGMILAAEAYARNFFSAADRAFLGDGLAYNWRIQEKWFKDFIPILDFIHALSYVYMTSKACSQTSDESWERYVRWMTACWQGRVDAVLVEMRQEQQKLQQRLGEADGKLSSSDPREVVRRSVNYLQNNASRMNYPTYRQRGLVVTTASVESLVKEFNSRVKGTEKFWNNPQEAEGILQVRAAILSQDDRLGDYLDNRPGCVFRKRSSAQTQETRRAA
jgi:hypothetical protein